MSASPISAVIFGSQWFLKSVILAERALRHAQSSRDFRVLAVCDVSEHPSAGRPRVVAGRLLRRAFEPESGMPLRRELAWSLQSVADRHRVKLMRPPGFDVNHPEFVNALERLQPTLALSFACPQILGKRLLGLFSLAVNCHGGSLPEYKGYACLEWSIYNGEPRTGFSYHYMTDEVDAGPVILKGDVPIGGQSLAHLRYAKAKLAASMLAEVLQAVARREPGQTQASEGRIYCKADAQQMMTVQHPQHLTWEELARRIRAFGSLDLCLDRQPYRVTRLTQIEGNSLRRKRSFVTADGIRVVASRYESLPYSLHRTLR